MGSILKLGAGGLTMSQGTYLEPLLLLALGLCLDQRSGAWGLQHRHECGSYSMQLLVFPRPGRMIRFKVVDEFGTHFEVTNCSICLHWITSEPQGPAIFSAGYRGCHVMRKDGQYHLRVFVEELLGTHVDEAQDVTLICPKSEHPKNPDTPLPHSVSNHTSPSPSPTRLLPHPPHPPLPPHRHPDLKLLSRPSVADHRPRSAHNHPTQSSPGTSTLVYQFPPSHTGSPRSREQCQVLSGRIPCVEGASSKTCLQAGCCYDDTDTEVPCYYGNTATAQCFEDGRFVLVVSQNTTSEKQVSLESIRLAYASGDCSPTQRTENFVVFDFLVTQCGTTIQLVDNQLIYENQLVSDIEVQTGPEGAITRDSTFLLQVRCIYNTSDFLPLHVEVSVPSPLAPVLQTGPLHLELRIARDKDYTSYYYKEDFPLFMMLRDPLYIEVRLLRKTDPNLVLVLHHCWATPSTNPFKKPQWPLLDNGCPFAGDGYKTQLAPNEGASESPFPTHHQRFSVATFTFMDSASKRALGGSVYFFCSASVCYPSEKETCRAACRLGAMKRRQRFVDSLGYVEGPQDIVGSPGPVGFEKKTDLQDKESPPMDPDSEEGSMVSRPNISEPLLQGGSSWSVTLRPLLWVSLSLGVLTVFLVAAVLLGRNQKLREQSGKWEQSQ